MRLNKLTLQGYKTFATRTDFVFDGNITAIVGPNGSGKSNIADAIRWVLGEQSYLTLRGKRTTDMIFAGGRNRSRAGMAQVLLTLDNTEGWLPIDYSEIEIGRRAYRSSENEYLLNGQKVRLRDVSDLLANSGLSERTYTIIGQGMIDRALSLRPDERRALFEEAAGIGLYKSKRTDALRKLQETRSNLDRVHDILTEITPRLRKLKRQSNKARNYDQVASDLRNQLRHWYGYRWQQERQHLRLRREEQTRTENEWNDGQLVHNSLRHEIEEQRQHLQSHRLDIQRIQDQRVAVKEELEKTRRLHVAAKERQSMLAQESERVDQRLELLEQSINNSRTKLQEAIEELQSSDKDQESAESLLVKFEQDIGEQQNEINTLEISKRTIEGELQEIIGESSKSEGRLIQIKEGLTSIEASQGDIGNLEAAKEQKITAENTALEHTNKLDKIRSELTELKKESKTLEGVSKSLDRDLSLTKKDLDKLRNEMVQTRSQLEIYGQHTEFGQDLSETSDVLGWISQFASVQPQYESVLRAALSEGRNALLVSDETALWKLVEYGLKENKSLLATAPTANLKEDDLLDHPDFGTRLSDLIETEAEFADVVRRVLGNIYLIDDPKIGLARFDDFPSGSMLITRDGLILKDGGLVRYRSSQDVELKETRQSKLIEIKSLLVDQESLLTKLELRQQQELTQINSAEELLAAHIEKVNSLEIQERKVNDQLSEAKLNQDLSDQEYRHIIQRRDQIAQDEELLYQRRELITTEIDRLNTRNLEIDKELELVEKALLKLPVAETKQERKLLSQQVQSARTISAGRQAVVDSRHTTLDQIQEQYDQAAMHRNELLKQQSGLEIEQHRIQVERSEENHRSLEQALIPANVELESESARLNDLEKELDRQIQRNSGLETSYTQARIDYAQQENQVESLKERIIAELGLVDLAVDEDEVMQSPLPMTDVVEELPEVEDVPEDIEEAIQHLRGQLTRMGAINPDAPAEFEELQDRHIFLVNQVTDLEETSERLSQIVDELDELTSRSFGETVKKVDGEFRQVFTRLFGGGAAQLVLTDPEDITFTGVDIVARLPGRREQNLGLLSGGERALTAAALIFSLLKVSPTPFCVLDEVDAMLDEANIRRFRELLCELSLDTQFVVITHNRGTIEVADNVYGVSMSADSASQVISIKPEEYVSI